MDPRRRQHAQDFDEQKSIGSSFYGGRRSADILNGNTTQAEHLPLSQSDHRQRYDSSTSFYGRNVEDSSPNREDYSPTFRTPPPRSSEGYGRPSFAQSGQSQPVRGLDDDDEQGAGWDVYADFNNAGPRYTNNLLQKATNSEGYQPLKAPEKPALKGTAASSSYEPQVELVTVPKLGAEWSAGELRDMTKSGKKELATMERKKKWREWNRDQRGLFGSKWGYRKVIVWTTFFLVIVMGLLLVFLLPRVPSFAFNDDSPINPTGGEPHFQRLPANFSFQGALDLQVNTHSSFIPVHFNSLDAELYLLETSNLIATGSLGPWTFKAKAYTPITLPITFEYAAANASDTTWATVYDSCRHRSQFPGSKRPGLNVKLVLKMKIRGLIPTHGASTSILGASCPVELEPNAG